MNHGPTWKRRVWAAWLQGHGLWALGVGRVDGCWVGNLERSGRCGWSCVYTITPVEGSMHAVQGLLGFISEKPGNQKCLGDRREAHAGQCP